MSQQPEHQTGDNTYSSSSQPAGQTNPFTADLKGEFTSNFGTNTNAVSQIFKEGQFSESKSKMYVIIAAILLIGGGAFYYLTSEDDFSDDFGSDEVVQTDDEFADDDFADETPAANETKDETKDETAEESAVPAMEEKTMTETAAATETSTAVATEAVAEEAPAATDAPVLSTPQDQARRSYDETTNSAEFTWEGSPGGWILFSRSPSMAPVTMKVKVSGNSYMFNNPWPGTWYWRVDNGMGSSEVRSFVVEAPVRRNVVLAEPQSGAAVSGNGGVVSWQGDTGVAYYKVEVTDGSWANPAYKFSTSGTQIQLQNVPAGQYQLRVGAFSEISGRWEYTAPVTVSVQ